MPTYEYQCDECGHHEEVVQKITAEPLHTCPECGSGTYHRLIAATGFILKGSGWYKTDYAAGSAGNGSGGGAKESTESKGSEGKEATD